MKIAIIGNGGREHAIADQISKSLNSISCIAYREMLVLNWSENVNLDIYDFNKLGKFVEKNKIDFVIVGPEKPLVEGVVDFLEKKE